MQSQSAIAFHLPLLLIIFLSAICHVVNAEFDPDLPPPTMTVLPFNPVPTMDPKGDNEPGVIYARPGENPFKIKGNIIRGPKYKARFAKFDTSEIPLVNGSDVCDPPAGNQGPQQKWANHFAEMLTPDGLVQPLGFSFNLFKSLEKTDPEGVKGERTVGRSFKFEFKKLENKNNSTPDPGANKRWIIGKDDRVEIKNTWLYPYSAVGQVGTGCTGTLIGPRHVLTAGHCVHSGKGGTWHSNLNFTIFRTPGVTGQYDRISWDWSQVFSVKGWTQEGKWEYDYALIILKTADTRQPWMSFGWHNGLSAGWKLNLNGFPSDKAPQSMWHSYGPVIGTSNLRFDHEIDLMTKESGSGIYRFDKPDKRVIYGIQSTHSTACVPNFPDFWNCHTVKWNTATRINQQRFKQICGWMNTNLC